MNSCIYSHAPGACTVHQVKLCELSMFYVILLWMRLLYIEEHTQAYTYKPNTDINMLQAECRDIHKSYVSLVLRCGDCWLRSCEESLCLGLRLRDSEATSP